MNGLYHPNVINYICTRQRLLPHLYGTISTARYQESLIQFDRCQGEYGIAVATCRINSSCCKESLWSQLGCWSSSVCLLFNNKKRSSVIQSIKSIVDTKNQKGEIAVSGNLNPKTIHYLGAHFDVTTLNLVEIFEENIYYMMCSG